MILTGTVKKTSCPDAGVRMAIRRLQNYYYDLGASGMAVVGRRLQICTQEELLQQELSCVLDRARAKAF